MAQLKLKPRPRPIQEPQAKPLTLCIVSFEIWGEDDHGNIEMVQQRPLENYPKIVRAGEVLSIDGWITMSDHRSRKQKRKHPMEPVHLTQGRLFDEHGRLVYTHPFDKWLLPGIRWNFHFETDVYLDDGQGTLF